MILVLLFGLGLIHVLAAVNHTSLVFGLLTKDFLADAPLRYDFLVRAAVQAAMNYPIVNVMSPCQFYLASAQRIIPIDTILNSLVGSFMPATMSLQVTFSMFVQINFNGMCQKCLIGNFLCVDACGNNYPAPMWFKTFADVVLLFKFRQDTQNQWVIDATSSAVLRASESLCKTDTIIGLKNDIQNAIVAKVTSTLNDMIAQSGSASLNLHGAQAIEGTGVFISSEATDVLFSANGALNILGAMDVESHATAVPRLYSNAAQFALPTGWNQSYGLQGRGIDSKPVPLTLLAGVRFSLSFIDGLLWAAMQDFDGQSLRFLSQFAILDAEFYVNIDTTRPVLSMAYLDHVKFAFDSLKLVSVCGGLGLPRPVNTTRPFLALGVSQFSVIVSFLMQAAGLNPGILFQLGEISDNWIPSVYEPPIALPNSLIDFIHVGATKLLPTINHALLFTTVQLPPEYSRFAAVPSLHVYPHPFDPSQGYFEFESRCSCDLGSVSIWPACAWCRGATPPPSNNTSDAVVCQGSCSACVATVGCGFCLDGVGSCSVGSAIGSISGSCIRWVYADTGANAQLQCPVAVVDSCRAQTPNLPIMQDGEVFFLHIYQNAFLSPPICNIDVPGSQLLITALRGSLAISDQAACHAIDPVTASGLFYSLRIQTPISTPAALSARLLCNDSSCANCQIVLDQIQPECCTKSADASMTVLLQSTRSPSLCVGPFYSTANSDNSDAVDGTVMASVRNSYTVVQQVTTRLFDFTTERFGKGPYATNTTIPIAAYFNLGPLPVIVPASPATVPHVALPCQLQPTRECLVEDSGNGTLSLRLYSYMTAQNTTLSFYTGHKLLSNGGWSLVPVGASGAGQSQRLLKASQIVTTLVCHTLVPQSTFPLFGSTAWLIALILVMVVMCSVAVAVRIHRMLVYQLSYSHPDTIHSVDLLDLCCSAACMARYELDCCEELINEAKQKLIQVVFGVSFEEYLRFWSLLLGVAGFVIIYGGWWYVDPFHFVLSGQLSRALGSSGRYFDLSVFYDNLIYWRLCVRGAIYILLLLSVLSLASFFPWNLQLHKKIPRTGRWLIRSARYCYHCLQLKAVGREEFDSPAVVEAVAEAADLKSKSEDSLIEGAWKAGFLRLRLLLQLALALSPILFLLFPLYTFLVAEGVSLTQQFISANPNSASTVLVMGRFAFTGTFYIYIARLVLFYLHSIPFAIFVASLVFSLPTFRRHCSMDTLRALVSVQRILLTIAHLIAPVLTVSTVLTVMQQAELPVSWFVLFVLLYMFAFVCMALQIIHMEADNDRAIQNKQESDRDGVVKERKEPSSVGFLVRKWLHGPVYIITYIVLTHVIISLESQKSGYEVGFVVLTFYASAMMWYLVHQGCSLTISVLYSWSQPIQERTHVADPAVTDNASDLTPTASHDSELSSGSALCDNVVAHFLESRAPERHGFRVHFRRMLLLIGFVCAAVTISLRARSWLTQTTEERSRELMAQFGVDVVNTGLDLSQSFASPAFAAYSRFGTSSVLLEVSGLVVLFVALLLDHLGDDRLALSKMCSFVSLFLFFCSMTVIYYPPYLQLSQIETFLPKCASEFDDALHSLLVGLSGVAVAILISISLLPTHFIVSPALVRSMNVFIITHTAHLRTVRRGKAIAAADKEALRMSAEEIGMLQGLLYFFSMFTPLMMALPMVLLVQFLENRSVIVIVFCHYFMPPLFFFITRFIFFKKLGDENFAFNSSMVFTVVSAVMAIILFLYISQLPLSHLFSALTDVKLYFGLVADAFLGLVILGDLMSFSPRDFSRQFRCNYCQFASLEDSVAVVIPQALELPSTQVSYVTAALKIGSSTTSAASMWTQYSDDQGNVYFYNHQTNESSWTLPTGI